MMLRNRSVIDYFFLRLKYSLRPVCQLQVAGGAAAVNPSKALNSQPCYFKFGAVNRSLLYFINRISLVPTFFKSQSALIPLLLLSDRDSLRWIRARPAKAARSRVFTAWVQKKETGTACLFLFHTFLFLTFPSVTQGGFYAQHH